MKRSKVGETLTAEQALYANLVRIKIDKEKKWHVQRIESGKKMKEKEEAVDREDPTEEQKVRYEMKGNKCKRKEIERMLEEKRGMEDGVEEKRSEESKTRKEEERRMQKERMEDDRRKEEERRMQKERMEDWRKIKGHFCNVNSGTFVTLGHFCHMP